MLCQECNKNQATTHFTVVENGVKKEYDLCPECAMKLGAIAFSPFAFGKLFSQGCDSGSRQIACSHCGTTLQDLQQSSLLGCEYCYEDLSAGIAPILRTVQKSANHTGRGPEKKAISAEEKPAEALRENGGIDDLQKQLDEAVSLEEFEKAAKLRDQIKSLKEKGGNA